MNNKRRTRTIMQMPIVSHSFFTLFLFFYCTGMYKLTCVVLMYSVFASVISNTNTKFLPHLQMRFEEYLRDNDFGWLLSDIIEKISDEINCLAIITDKYYNDLFTNEIFRLFSSFPMFKILIKENEDLLTPNYNTLSVVQQARRKGCNTYIVLIANGYQTIRFLRFGDRNRVIDTRARYILLYDIRLLTKEHHYLWKKIVNVIFLRKFFEVNRYEFTTVPFPSPILDNLKLVWLDSWKAGKFQKNNDLFNDKTSNLYGEVAHVATFEYMPSAIKKVFHTVKNEDDNEDYSDIDETSIEYSGLEIQIMESLSQAMNFQARIYEPGDSVIESWGRKQLNGTYTGLLGEMVSGRADIALGNFLYTPKNLQLLDLSIPYTTQCFTFLTPESTNDNSWKTLILPFKGYMWLGVLLALIISSLVFYGLAKFHNYLYKDQVRSDKIRAKYSFWKDLFKLWKEKKTTMKKESIKSLDEDIPTGLHIFQGVDSSLLNAFSMLLLVSLPKMPSGWSLRMFTGFWWVYCILVTVAYRASMTAILANPAQRITIDSLEELAASSIGCGGWGEQSMEFFTTSLDSAGQRVGRKFEIIYDKIEAIQRVAEGSFAYYENIYFLHNVKATQTGGFMKTDESESNLTRKSERKKDLHIMRNCVINMPISLGLQKNSPLKPRVDKFLQRVIEAGLVKKWLADVMLNSTVIESQQEKSGLKALMDLKKFVGALVALGVGYFLGAIILLFENIYWNYVVKRNPLFDKYHRIS